MENKMLYCIFVYISNILTVYIWYINIFSYFKPSMINIDTNTLKATPKSDAKILAPLTSYTENFNSDI